MSVGKKSIATSSPSNFDIFHGAALTAPFFIGPRISGECRRYCAGPGDQYPGGIIAGTCGSSRPRLRYDMRVAAQLASNRRRL